MHRLDPREKEHTVVSGIWFQRIAIILPVRIFLGSLTFKNKLSYNPHAKAVAIRCNNIFFGKRNIEFELKSGTLTLYFSLIFFKFSSFVKETTAAFFIRKILTVRVACIDFSCCRSGYSTRVVSLTVSNPGNQMDSGQQQAQVAKFKGFI